MNILDCSIRDGGHLNKWRFDEMLVKRSYQAAVKAGTDVFEVGYRFPRTIDGLGSFGYCSDAFVHNVFADIYNPKCKLAVMIDTGKCETSQFADAKDSLISVVRVAAYPHELEKAIRQTEELHAKGYKVCLNPMASSELTKDHFKLFKDWKEKDFLMAVYFADSFGTYTPYNVVDNIWKFNDVGFPRIGFHAHNNLQMAVANTLVAVENKIDWIDATIFGIGRGAGNAPIEIVMGLLSRLGYDYKCFPYLELAQDSYQHLFDELDWAVKPQTIMGGLKNVHPYYMEDLFKQNVSTRAIWEILDEVKQQCPISYSRDALQSLIDSKGAI